MIVIQFPVRRSCFQCRHYSVEGWCEMYNEPIDSEQFAAKDCPSFEEEE